MGIDPVSLAVASLAVSAVGVGVSAVASAKEAKAANRAADYNEKIGEINAQSAEARGKVEEKQHRLRVARLKGTQRVAAAASGVVVDVGSPLDQLIDTEIFGELDALTIRQNAAQEAWGYRASAVTGRRDPGLAFGTTLLTGASRLGAQYLGFQKEGFFKKGK